jgi:hypothetical protein
MLSTYHILQEANPADEAKKILKDFGQNDCLNVAEFQGYLSSLKHNSGLSNKSEKHQVLPFVRQPNLGNGQTLYTLLDCILSQHVSAYFFLFAFSFNLENSLTCSVICWKTN